MAVCSSLPIWPRRVWISSCSSWVSSSVLSFWRRVAVSSVRGAICSLIYALNSSVFARSSLSERPESLANSWFISSTIGRRSFTSLSCFVPKSFLRISIIVLLNYKKLCVKNDSAIAKTAREYRLHTFWIRAKDVQNEFVFPCANLPLFTDGKKRSSEIEHQFPGNNDFSGQLFSTPWVFSPVFFSKVHAIFPADSREAYLTFA